MNARRTDLALEAHALFRAAQKDDAIDGLTLTERTRRGCAVTTVTVESKAASRALGKPRGTYVTLDLRTLPPEDPEKERRIEFYPIRTALDRSKNIARTLTAHFYRDIHTRPRFRSVLSFITIPL